MKPCTKCKEPKELTEFNNNKTAKDGKCCWCRACEHEYKISDHYKELNAKRIKKRGLMVLRAGKFWDAIHNQHLLLRCKTRQAAEQVIAKYRLRKAKRKIEKAREKNYDVDYWRTL
jgi:hypothetical protein